MACKEFEDRLVDYPELSGDERLAVDSHLAGCAECRAFREVLAEVDSTLAAAFSGLNGPAALPHTVMSRIETRTPARRPSFVPELLDLTGGAAVLAVALLLLPICLSGLALDVPSYWVTGVLFMLIGLFVAYRSYAELEH